MIYIYKLVEKNNKITNDLIDTWDNGKFKNSSEKMNRDEVIDRYNNSYYFTSDSDVKDNEINFDPMGKNPDGHKSKNKKDKVLINKFELSKAVNINVKSGESGYTLTPRSYDKENRKFENGVVNDMDKWMKDQEKNLKNELKRFYKDLDF